MGLFCTLVGRLHSPQGQSSLKASQQVEGAAAPDVRLWEGEEYGISGIPWPPLNIISLCGWSKNTWAAPTLGGARMGLLGSFGWASETSNGQAGADF